MCIINFFEPEGLLIKFTQRNANILISGVKPKFFATYAGPAGHALQVMNILPDMKVMQGMQCLQVTQLGYPPIPTVRLQFAQFIFRLKFN